MCTENRLRSATAEAVFTEMEGVQAIGAGTNKDAPTPVSGDLIEWADVVLCMEPVHLRKVNKAFGPLLKGKTIVSLGIPDRFAYMDPSLVRLLKDRAAKYLPVM